MTDRAKERKGTPIYSGVLKYFPEAIEEVARTSQAGNDQHHPGKELHWDKSKSLDHADALARHLLDAGTLDDDGIRHSAKVAWRALALLQTEIEREEQEAFEERVIAFSKEEDLMYPQGYGPCSAHAFYDEETSEIRMKNIGRNGNDGQHYSHTGGYPGDVKITFDEI